MQYANLHAVRDGCRSRAASHRYHGEVSLRTGCRCKLLPCSTGYRFRWMHIEPAPHDSISMGLQCHLMSRMRLAHLPGFHTIPRGTTCMAGHLCVHAIHVTAWGTPCRYSLELGLLVCAVRQCPADGNRPKKPTDHVSHEVSCLCPTFGARQRL